MKLAKINRISMICIAALGVAACDENGEFALPSAPAASAQDDAPLPANAPNQTFQEERDIERPDIFEANDSGLWDGRPSLGGVWVAHPDVRDPERVLITNTENGRSIVGALFRRERENPGPLLQVSSDAADELGILAGAPTAVTVVALRREEVQIVAPVADENPVVSGLESPVTVEAAPLEPAPVASPAAPSAAAAAVVLPPALEAATAAAEATAAATAAAASVTDDAVTEDAPIDVSAVLSAPTAPADGPIAQIGVFSVEANANAAVSSITAAGIAAQVAPQDMGGRTVWAVTAGPLVDASDVSQLKALGFVDAFIVEDAQ